MYTSYYCPRWTFSTAQLERARSGHLFLLVRNWPESQLKVTLKKPNKQNPNKHQTKKPQTKPDLTARHHVENKNQYITCPGQKTTQNKRSPCAHRVACTITPDNWEGHFSSLCSCSRSLTVSWDIPCTAVLESTDVSDGLEESLSILPPILFNLPAQYQFIYFFMLSGSHTVHTSFCASPPQGDHLILFLLCDPVVTQQSCVRPEKPLQNCLLVSHEKKILLLEGECIIGCFAH